MKKVYIIITTILMAGCALGQSVGINTATPHASAILDVKNNGAPQSWTLPKIHLTSVTDKSVIVGEDPANALMIYNTNGDLPAGKGIYYWDATDGRWQFIVSQHTIALFRDLTRYYTKDTEAATALSTAPSGLTNFTLNSSTAGWTMIKDTDGTNLTMPIQIEQPENYLDVNLSGTWITALGNNNDNVNRGFDVAYGIFVDGQLKYVKTESLLALNPCNINSFYVNAIIPNLSPTLNLNDYHNVTFGVRLRRVQGTGNNTTNFPSGTSLKIGGAPSGASRGCKNANAFENTTKATIYVNQTL